MGWKNIIRSSSKTAEQLGLFPEPELSEEAIENPPSDKKRRRGRSQYYILQPYTARTSSNCNTHPSECHLGGRVKEGDDMIVAIGMPKTKVAGARYYFHADGPCEHAGIKKLDEEAARLHYTDR